MKSGGCKVEMGGGRGPTAKTTHWIIHFSTPVYYCERNQKVKTGRPGNKARVSIPTCTCPLYTHFDPCVHFENFFVPVKAMSYTKELLSRIVW